MGGTAGYVWSAVDEAPVEEVFPGIRVHIPQSAAGCTLFVFYPEG